MPDDRPSVRLVDPANDADRALYTGELDLRFRVLRAPLGLVRGSEVYDAEGDCLHLVAVDGQRVIGCVLFHPQGAYSGRLLQMAVEPAWQRKGVGRRLVGRLEAELQPRGFAEVVLHARDHAVGFYEGLGYHCFGEPFAEVGIPHRLMKKRLNPA